METGNQSPEGSEASNWVRSLDSARVQALSLEPASTLQVRKLRNKRTGG